MAEAAALSVGGKIAGCLIEPIQRELGYLFCFNSNIQELETGLDQLIRTRNDVQRSEDEARSSRKTRGEVVDGWINEANENITEAQKFINEKLPEIQKGCFSIKWCPNLKLRFSLGRKGKKLSLVLDDLLQRADKLPQTTISLSTPSINMRDYNGDASDFDSRGKPMEEIIELLQDKETRLIGICGMGGIGKTTFANQLLQKVQDSHKHLFDKQVISTVSSSPDYKTIQQVVVEMLEGPSLKEIESEVKRAELLRNTFKDKKVVVVLDDVWEEFDLNALGFPLSNSDVCCKIIYTSRTKDLWARQQTKKEIPLDKLSDNKSLNLFIREANLNDGDADFQTKKEKSISIVKECKGLPLALKVAGGALINKEMWDWNTMLSRLENHHDHETKINEVLETSYNSLKDNNEKLLFLLCCLFKEDHGIPIESLYRYAVGLQFFKDMTSLREIRDRVYTLVGDLIRRNLLIKDIDYLPRGEILLVKMHDVVRDVGITLLKKDIDYLGYFVGDGLNDLENVKMISILFSRMDLKIFNKMGFRDSQFELLKLDEDDLISDQLKISEDFFQGMDILKVLDINQITRFRFYRITRFRTGPRLKEFSYSSFPNLVKLKMLSLESLNITTNLSSIRHLSCLKILSFRRSTMNVLPNEISELTNLEVLDLTGCKCLISKGILSKLTNLQELYMWNSFLDWSVPKKQYPQRTTDEDNNDAAELIEINMLNKLWILELEVSNIEQVQKGVTLLSSSKSLEYFKIRIGRESGNNGFESGERQLLLENIIGNFHDELGNIIKNKITNLYLYKSSVIWENMHEKGFLKDIVLRHCDGIITLFPHSQSSPPHPSNGLGRGREEYKIPDQSNSLETLMLDGLFSLESFCKGINEIHFDKLKRLELKGLKKFIFPTKLRIPCLKKLIIESIPNLKSLCNFVAPSLNYELTIRNCEDFMYVFSTTSIIINKNISRISKLHIQGCKNFKGIIFISTDVEEEGNKSFSFSNLQNLSLESLDELVSFVINGNEGEKMQNALFYQVIVKC